MGKLFTLPIGGQGTGMRTGWGVYFKNTHDYRNRIFNNAVNTISAKSWGLQSRYGLGMKWSKRVRRTWGWGLTTQRMVPPKRASYKYYRELSLRIIKSSKEIREWITLIKIRSGFGCDKSSIKMGGQLESGQPKLKLHLL